MFSSRKEAGQKLAQKLVNLKVSADLVLGIARGGVVVAVEIAKRLKSSLDTVVVKKLGAPHNPELAIGAIAGNATFIDTDLALVVGADQEYIKQEIQRKQKELSEREKLLRKGRAALDLVNKKVILTDDGVATGATVQVALELLKKQKPYSLTLALPVAVKDIASRLKRQVDQLEVLATPDTLGSVGQFYRDFRQVTDEEVVNLLRSGNEH